LLHLQQVPEGTPGPFSARQLRPDPSRDRGSIRLVDVLFARPEEPAQTVLATTRHDVGMKVRDALTDNVVDRHNQHVAPKERRPIEERDGPLVANDNVGGDAASDNLAEYA